MQTTIDLIRSLVYANPVKAIRHLLNRKNVTVVAGNDLFEIFPCYSSQSYHFNLTPMTSDCYSKIPITYDIEGHLGKGFIDPVTNEVLSSEYPQPCHTFRPLPIELDGKVYTYHRNGTLHREKHFALLPAIELFPAHVDILDPETIFHNIIIQSSSDISQHVSANDLLHTLKAQSQVLTSLGLGSDAPPASSNKSFFGKRCQICTLWLCNRKYPQPLSNLGVSLLFTIFY